MADNKKIAEEVLAAVGGAENVTSAMHCMTRLRLNLKDQSVPNDDEIKKIQGVLGAQWSGGQYQVIIGQNVPKVYDEVLKLGVGGAGSIDENLDAPKEKLTAKSVGSSIMNYLSKSMVALIPIMMGAAMFRTIAVIAGPQMLGLWAEDSQIYQLFYQWLYDAGFYFMPLSLGYSAAKQLKCSPMLGIFMGGVLIMPGLVSAAAAVADGGPATIAVYGIPHLNMGKVGFIEKRFVLLLLCLSRLRCSGGRACTHKAFYIIPKSSICLFTAFRRYKFFNFAFQ